MTTQTVPGTLIATPDEATLAREACSRIVKHIRDALRDRPFATVALSGGGTPKRTYELLAAEAIELDRVHFFYVDERAVPPESERSNHRMVALALGTPASGRRPEIHRMRAEGDLEVAKEEYTALLKAHVEPSRSGFCAFDVIVLGIGDDGHTASLFPGEPLVQERNAWVVAVPPGTGHEARLSLTAPVLESAKQILILASGRGKTPALERVWSVKGSLEETPARLVRHATGYVTWIVDREAAGL